MLFHVILSRSVSTVSYASGIKNNIIPSASLKNKSTCIFMLKCVHETLVYFFNIVCFLVRGLW